MRKLNNRSCPYALSTRADFERQLRMNGSIFSILSFTSHATQLKFQQIARSQT